MLDWLKEEMFTAYGLVVYALILFTAGLIGQFFGGIGDYLFGQKETKDD
jgi:hypothetical protein